jgi:ectoine hydroxylase-related dioxygenase (phytanoyl-CoA dioxygenase family)
VSHHAAAVGATREQSHAIYTKIDESQETIVDVPATRGSVIIHHEATVHASRPNLSSAWRHAYILNFRCSAPPSPSAPRHAYILKLQVPASGASLPPVPPCLYSERI